MPVDDGVCSCDGILGSVESIRTWTGLNASLVSGVPSGLHFSPIEPIGALPQSTQYENALRSVDRDLVRIGDGGRNVTGGVNGRWDRRQEEIRDSELGGLVGGLQAVACVREIVLDDLRSITH